jgi:glycosyltransferase involved in cell wall biosynthesis
MNISFLTSGHFPYDDRIFWHMGKTLSEAGHSVEITSSKLFLKELAGGISLNCFDGENFTKKDKTEHFIDLLSKFHPDIIICSEPLPVIAGKRYRKKYHSNAIVIYDITEWYPSRKNLAPFKLFLKPVIFLKLLSFNLIASWFADAFIFGEFYKSRPYRFLFPNKPFACLTYFPDLKYFEKTEPRPLNGKLQLLYSGKISLDKGFGNFVGVVQKLSRIYPFLQLNLKIVGWYESDNDRNECEPLLNLSNKNIIVEIKGRESFTGFISEIKETDIFLDLRKSNFETQRSLPIKLFHYAATGRPVIFTDLRAIRRDITIEKFGYLVKPEETNTITEILCRYLQDQDLYLEHCRNARKLAEEKYNWQQISPALLNFIDSFPRR